MKKIEIHIDGMMCGMCESHVNAALRNGLGIDSVHSNARKGITIATVPDTCTLEDLHRVLDPTGYRILEVKELPETKGWKSFFHH